MPNPTPTESTFVLPTGACRGSCNYRAAQEWTAYYRALDTHIAAYDQWIAGGQQGDPPDEPAQPKLTFYPGAPLFCERDVAATRRSLLELDTQAAQLAAHSDGQRGQGDGNGKISGSKTTPSISPTADILDRMLGDLFDLEDEYRQARAYPARVGSGKNSGPRGAHPRTKTISWLAAHIPGILELPDFIDLPRTVFNWERVLRRLNKDSRAAINSPIRCPGKSCGERRVKWDDEHHYYLCGACGNVLYQDEHDRHEEEQADAAEVARLAAGPAPAAVGHQVLVPGEHDDAESRKAGPRDPHIELIWINRDLQLVFGDPYRRWLSEEEFDGAPWPACPQCGAPISVERIETTAPGQERTFMPGQWRCSAGCGTEEGTP